MGKSWLYKKGGESKLFNNDDEVKIAKSDGWRDSRGEAEEVKPDPKKAGNGKGAASGATTFKKAGGS